MASLGQPRISAKTPMALRYLPDGTAHSAELWSNKDARRRCPMLCPRCHRVRIERNGVIVRCAVCGMSYDPNPQATAPSPKPGAPSPHRIPPAQSDVIRNDVIHSAVIRVM